MKVKIKKKGSDAVTEISLADLLLNVATVSDRNEEKTIKIDGETYLLDTIEDIQKDEEVKTDATPVSTDTGSNTESNNSGEVQP